MPIHRIGTNLYAVVQQSGMHTGGAANTVDASFGFHALTNPAPPAPGPEPSQTVDASQEYFINTAEGGTDGINVSTANSGGASGDAWSTVSGTGTTAFDDDEPTRTGHGAFAYKFSPPSGNSQYVAWAFDSAEQAQVCVYGHFPTWPATPQRIISIRNATTDVAVFEVNTSGLFVVKNAASATLDTTSTGLSSVSGVWYRFELRVIKGTTTSNGTIEWAVYDGDMPTPIISGSNTATNTGTTSIVEARFGKTDTGAGTMSLHLDTLRLWTAGSIPETLNNAYVPPVLVTGAQATETDTAFAGDKATRRVGTQVVETDQARGGHPTGAIAYVDSTQATNISSTATVPAPSGMADGDVVVLVLTLTSSTPTTPAGFKYVGGTTSGTISSYIYVKGILDVASEPTDYTVSWGSGENWILQALAYRGADPYWPVTAALDATGTGTTASVGSVTPVDDGSAVIAVHAATGTTTLTTPSGFTLREEDEGAAPNVQVSDQIQGSAAATGAISSTVSSSVTWIARYLVLRPVSALEAGRVIPVGSSSATGDNVGTGTVPIAVPDGVVDGDVLLLAIQTTSTRPITTLAGWNLVQYDDTGTQEWGVYYRVANSEPASYSPAWTGGTTDITMGMVAYRNADQTTPINVSGEQYLAVSGTVLDSPDVTSTVDNGTAVFIGMTAQLSTQVTQTSFSSTVMPRLNISNVASVTGVLGIADKPLGTAGTVTGEDWNISVANTSRYGVTVVLAPVSAVLVAGSLATETDTANAGVTNISRVGTQATETDTANAGVRYIRKTGTLVTETDTGRTGTPVVVKQGALATETDSAFAGALAIRRPGSLATETDAGLAGAAAVAPQGQRATETDSAFAGTVAEPGVWRPSADASNTGWTNESGSSSNLWASIDEPFAANDSDYVQSPVGAGAVVKFDTGNIAAPSATGRALRVRYQGTGAGSGTLYVRVRDGATLVAERSWVVPAGSGWVDQDVTLTGPEVALISSPDNLQLELEAVPA